MGGDLDTRIAALWSDRYFRTITIDADPDMRFVGGDYIEDGTEVEVHCLVSYGELDERQGKLLAEVDGREVELSVWLLDAVMAEVMRVPDAAEAYVDRMNI